LRCRSGETARGKCVVEEVGGGEFRGLIGSSRGVACGLLIKRLRRHTSGEYGLTKV
jgi:hypothetical protein